MQVFELIKEVVLHWTPINSVGIFVFFFNKKFEVRFLSTQKLIGVLVDDKEQ